MINRIPLRNVIDADCKFMVTKDRINNAYQNNVIFTEAKNEALKSAIDLCVKRFKERFMKRVPCGSLYHTGPFLFYDACHSYMDNEKNKVGLYFDAPFNNDDYRQYHLKSIYNNAVVFNTMYNGYYKQYNSVHKKPIWSEQWAKGEVYYTNKRVVGDKTIYVYPNHQNKDGPNKEYEFKMDYQTGELLLDCETKNTDGVNVKIIDDKNNKCSILNIVSSNKNNNETVMTNNLINHVHNNKLKSIHDKLTGNIKSELSKELPEQIMTCLFLREDDCVLELGGSIGRNSCVINNILRDRTNHVVIEPSMFEASKLLQNRDDNKLEFHIEKSAISDKPLFSREWFTYAEQVPGSVPVNVITLDELKSKYNMKFTALIVDNEGNFVSMLKAFPDLLQNIRLVQIEHDFNSIEDLNYFVNKMTQAGFKKIGDYKKTHVHGPGMNWPDGLKTDDTFVSAWEKPTNVRICYITAIYGNYETSCKPFVKQTINSDFICFTDNEKIISNGWYIDTTPYHYEFKSKLDDDNLHNSLVKNKHTFNIAKYYKQAFQNIPRLKDYDVVVWLDGTIEIIYDNVSKWILENIDEKHIIGWEHQWRRGSLYEEALDSTRNGRYTVTKHNNQSQPYQDVMSQYSQYMSNGYKQEFFSKERELRPHMGVWITCFVAFKNKCAQVTQFLDEWYLQTLKYTTQDQIGFPYVVQKTKLIPYTLPDKTINGADTNFKTDFYYKHNHGK